MADFAGIEPFSGDSSVNATEWMDRFENFVIFKGFKEQRRTAALSLLLRGGAQRWLATLPGDTKNSFILLKEAFLQRFKDTSPSWAKVADLFQRKQNITEDTENFITFMEAEGAKVDLPEQQVFQAVMKGLLPHIRQFVLLQNPQNLQELRGIARTAEAATKETTDTSSLVLERLQEVQVQIKNLSASQIELKSEVHTAVNAAAAVPSRLNNSGDSIGEQWLGDQRGNQEPIFHQQQNPRNRQGIQRLRARRNEAGLHQFYPEGGYYRSGAMQNFSSGYMCFVCGASDHHRSQCPAWQVICHNCGRRGHYARVCRSMQTGQSFLSSQ